MADTIGLDLGDLSDFEYGYMSSTIGLDLGDLSDFEYGYQTATAGVDLGDLIGSIGNSETDDTIILGLEQPARRKRKKIFIVC